MKISFSLRFFKNVKKRKLQAYPFDNKKQIERRQRIEGKNNIKNLLKQKFAAKSRFKLYSLIKDILNRDCTPNRDYSSSMIWRLNHDLTLWCDHSHCPFESELRHRLRPSG